MSNETTNLKLHKWNTSNAEDLKQKFDISKSLNENWDKLDEAIGEKTDSKKTNKIEDKINIILSQIPNGQATGDFITIKDSSDLPIKNIVIKGNTYQETSEGYNLCPTDADDWEIGLYESNDGSKSEESNTYHSKRARLKELVKITPSQEIYFNTFNSSYKFIIRAYDIEQNFVASIGPVKNDTSYTMTETYEYISIGIYNPSTDTDGQGQIILDSIENQTIKPLICLNTNETKEFERYGIRPSIENSSPIQSVTGENEIKFSNYDDSENQTFLVSLGENEIFEDGCLNIKYEENLGYKTVTKATIINNYYRGTYPINVDMCGSQREDQGFYFRITDIKSTAKILSTHQKQRSTAYDDVWQKFDGSCIGYLYPTENVRALYVNAPIEITNTADFITWWNELNPEICYELEMPTEIEITDKSLLSQLEALINAETYKNITNINASGETLNPDMEVAYKKDLDTYINSWELITEYVSEADGDIAINLGGEYKDVEIRFKVPSNTVSNGELLYGINGKGNPFKTRTTIGNNTTYYGVIKLYEQLGRIYGRSSISNHAYYAGDGNSINYVEADNINSISLHLWSGSFPTGTEVRIVGKK